MHHDTWYIYHDTDFMHCICRRIPCHWEVHLCSKTKLLLLVLFMSRWSLVKCHFEWNLYWLCTKCVRGPDTESCICFHLCKLSFTKDIRKMWYGILRVLTDLNNVICCVNTFLGVKGSVASKNNLWIYYRCEKAKKKLIPNNWHERFGMFTCILLYQHIRIFSELVQLRIQELLFHSRIDVSRRNTLLQFAEQIAKLSWDMKIRA